MKIIAFTTFAASLGLNIALASASPFQMAQRLRGNHEARELSCSEPERSDTCNITDGSDPPLAEKAYKPTSYLNTTSISTTDASLDDWGGSLGCLGLGIPMYEAGNIAKMHASDAYLNWDCSTGTLCILVKVRDGFYIKDNGGMWFKNYVVSQSAQVPIGSVQKISDTSGNLIAWEACYKVAADCLGGRIVSGGGAGVEIHANFDANGVTSTSGRTTSTGRGNAREGTPLPTGTPLTIALDLTCPCTKKEDCEIDACYAPSTCVGPDGTAVPADGSVEGICEYQVVHDNCCVKDQDDDDCAEGYQCVLPDTNTNPGKCQLKFGTPTPSPSTPVAPTSDGSQGTTSPKPTPAPTHQCTVASDCDLDSLLALVRVRDTDPKPNANKNCAQAVCNSNTCGVQDKVQGDKACEAKPESESENSCYRTHECNGVECVATYWDSGDSCKGNATADGYDEECVVYSCQLDTAAGAVPGRTICKAQIKKDDTCSEPGLRGDCDIGNKCSADGQCSSVGSYASTNVVCRDSAGPCDAPEYCTGGSHFCPQSDLKYGPSVQVVNALGESVDGDMVCRARVDSECTTGNCPDDVEEVCPGEQNACPSDVIFQKQLDLIAGKQYDAGYTTITATDLGLDGDLGTKVEVCVTIKLENEWQLQTDDSIKMELNNVGGLQEKNSPGSYGYKDLATRYQEPDGVTECYDFHILSDESSTIYFALHLDVKDASGQGQTAWALLPASTDGTASTTTGSLTPHVFNKKGTNGGPKVKVAATTEDGGGDGIGWGNWFTFSIGCATANDTCSKSTSTGGGETTTTTGTTAAPTTTTTAGAHTYTGTCFDAGGDELTCQHTTGNCTLNLNLFT